MKTLKFKSMFGQQFEFNHVIDFNYDSVTKSLNFSNEAGLSKFINIVSLQTFEEHEAVKKDRFYIDCYKNFFFHKERTSYIIDEKNFNKELINEFLSENRYVIISNSPIL